jgi:predicted enzyme involved in methoxymalonyl-ACP biosynthesis
MGRRVEELMVHLAAQAAHNSGKRQVLARLLPTERNRPCLEFWRKSSCFTEDEENVFAWDAARPYPKPEFIALDSKAEFLLEPTL